MQPPSSTPPTVIAVPFHLDERLPGLHLPLAADVVVDPVLPAGSVWERVAALQEQVATAVAAVPGGRPVVLSGDCTTSMGVVAGLQRAGVDPSVVWFDAHGDLQTPQTSTSGYLGGMPLRQLVGGADRTVPGSLGLRDVPERDVVLVDARDLDPPEAEFLAGSPIRHVPVGALADALPAGPIYLHLDVDVLDPRDVPGLLFPTPGGPSADDVAVALQTVLATGRVAAIGVGCTWHPDGDGGPAVAALVDALTAG
ncbi:MAG TPA: arginase family protein [Pseudonocardia sp.]|nr:arginase family protein [Pseudonocardia sp.]